jgi:hypothetical protein
MIQALASDMRHIGTAMAEVASSRLPYTQKRMQLAYWVQRRKDVESAITAAETALAAAYLAHVDASD